jgi:tetratricopeptide (TPR) repeat protein
VYRVDLPGKYSIKSDKNGRFTHAGLPYVGTYVLAVSAPNASPTTQPGVKVGREIEYEMVLNPGDGRRLSETEAKSGVSSGGGGSDSRSTGGGESAADKAKREELEKKNAEILAANKKIEDSNKILQDKFKLGNTAINSAQTAIKGNNHVEAEKLYSDAIREFDEGLAADPAHPGAPSLMTNKAIALKERGVLRYNSAITSEAYKSALSGGGNTAGAMLEPAKADWKNAFETASKAVTMLKAQEPSTDPSQVASAKQNLYFALVARAESANKFVTRVDPSQAEAGYTAYQEYLAAETDAVRKAKAQNDLAQMLFDANAYDRAKVEYERMLTEKPDDPDALANMGLILFNYGAAREGEGKKDEAKAMYQEAANYLQRFVDKAPEGHKFKNDAKAVLDALKSQQNVQAEKTTPPRRRRP